MSAAIAAMDDAQVHALLGSSETGGGWGKHQTVKVNGKDVFVKRIQITDLEYEAAYSTRNHFDLPLYYCYGVGSAGFGVFRELAMHVKTTAWVLDGAIANFPITYHHRILARSNDNPVVNEEQLSGYVKYWGGAESIGRLWRGRVHASRELVIFLEHFPHVLQSWLVQHQELVPEALDELRATVDFLRTHGVIHFDAHFQNIVTDGARPYLTDFGLALDRGFELSVQETAFFDEHTQYDYGEVLWSVGYLLAGVYVALTDDDKRAIRARLGIEEAIPLSDSLMEPLVNNVELLADEPTLGLHPSLVDAVVRYRDVIAVVQKFFVSLRANLRKDTPYPHAELRRLLRQCGVDG